MDIKSILNALDSVAVAPPPAQPNEQLQESSGLFQKYYINSEAALFRESVDKKQIIKDKARNIAERLSLKENAIIGHTSGFTGGVGPGLQSNEPTESVNEPDVIKLDVPLLMRLFEFAREDISSDEELHVLVSKLVKLSESGKTLTMNSYQKIVQVRK